MVNPIWWNRYPWKWSCCLYTNLATKFYFFIIVETYIVEVIVDSVRWTQSGEVVWRTGEVVGLLKNCKEDVVSIVYTHNTACVCSVFVLVLEISKPSFEINNNPQHWIALNLLIAFSLVISHSNMTKFDSIGTLFLLWSQFKLSKMKVNLEQALF